MLAILALPSPLAAPIDQKRCDLDHRAAILIRTRLPNPSLLRAHPCRSELRSECMSCDVRMLGDKFSAEKNAA